jgi:hypothetical protein
VMVATLSCTSQPKLRGFRSAPSIVVVIKPHHRSRQWPDR